jgi:hypothetical protein
MENVYGSLKSLAVARSGAAAYSPSPAGRLRQMPKAKSSPKGDKRRGRSKITNGVLLPGLDGRGVWVRRCRDLLELLHADLGGAANISEQENILVRRAITLVVELERREMLFAEAGAIIDTQLLVYQTAVNTLRRTLEALGLQRRARDITTPSLEQYAAWKKASVHDHTTIEIDEVVSDEVVT